MTELTLGQYLRQERENRGITIEQVASATKISVRLLHALEADQFPDLPATPFIRGFVTSYCRFVGLDERDVLTRYRVFIETRSKDRPAKDSGHSGYAFDRKDAERSRAVLWTVMSGFVVLGAVMIVLLRPALKHRRVSHIEQLRAAHGDKVAEKTAAPYPVQGASAATGAATAAPVVPAKSAATAAQAQTVTQSAAAPVLAQPSVAKPAPAPAVAEEADEDEQSDSASADADFEENAKDPLNKGDDLTPAEVKHKVVFRSLENIWVRYGVDDRKVTQFMLLKGKLLVLKGKEALRVQVSNPRAVEFRLGSAGGYRLLEGAKEVTNHNNTATLVVPSQVLGTTAEPFPGLPPLAKTPDPTRDDASGEITSDT